MEISHLRQMARVMAIASCLGAPLAASAGEVRFAGEGHAYTPAWSADGRYLAFEVNDLAGDVHMYVSEVKGDIARDGTKVALPSGSNPFGGSGQVVANAVWHKDGIAVFEADASF